MSEVLARRLMEQRVVLLHGPLDDATVTRVSAELMTLDAEGDEPVTLRLDCGQASLAPALTLMDVIELMGVPVRALCLGQVGGGAVGVLAVCAHRSAMPSTRFSLSEPTTHMEAHVRNVAQWAELRAVERRALLRTGRRRRREVARGVRRGSRAGPLLRRARGGRVRAARRSVPARRRDPDAAGDGFGLRFGIFEVVTAVAVVLVGTVEAVEATTHTDGIPPVALSARERNGPACLRFGHDRIGTTHRSAAA